MERRLRKVKTTMSIHAHRRTLELLDGEYASIHHGRSHDFDDLREYQPGDEVKDIDWKATARSHVPLIKRYIASRQHNLLLVVDSGRNMAATAESGESKREIAILVAGVLGYLATRHGDRVALLMGDEERREDMAEGGDILPALMKVGCQLVDARAEHSPGGKAETHGELLGMEAGLIEVRRGVNRMLARIRKLREG